MSEGLQDPWKRGSDADAATPKRAEDNGVGTRKSDHPFDADLKHDAIFVLQMGPGTRINVRGASTVLVAVAVILKAVYEEPLLQRYLASQNFELLPVAGEHPSGFYLKSADTVPVCLVNQTVNGAAAGLRALNRALRLAIRSDAALQSILKTRGITPLIE